LYTAPNVQLVMHLPHLMQSAWSMTWTSLTLPVIALEAQALAQRVQPVHFSGSMT
jgi:hypothetical protein